MHSGVHIAELGSTEGRNHSKYCHHESSFSSWLDSVYIQFYQDSKTSKTTHEYYNFILLFLRSHLPSHKYVKLFTFSFLLALNFFRQSTVSCLCIMEATVERCWKKRRKSDYTDDTDITLSIRFTALPRLYSCCLHRDDAFIGIQLPKWPQNRRLAQDCAWLRSSVNA